LLAKKGKRRRRKKELGGTIDVKKGKGKATSVVEGVVANTQVLDQLVDVLFGPRLSHRREDCKERPKKEKERKKER